MDRLFSICKPYFIYIVGALMLMALCFYNGYPLYMGDTHAYVSVAGTGMIPADRSPFYGWFIKHTSLRESLWLTILAQNLILSYVLLRYYRMLSGAQEIRDMAIFMILTVSFTYVTWVMSCLMSDVFTPILLLTTMLYFFEENTARPRQLVYLILIFISISMHNSHFLILCLVALALLVYALIKRVKVMTRKALLVMFTGVIYYFTMCAINAANDKGFIFSRGSNLFLVTKFAETGILDEYLNNNCENKNLKICEYKNEISPYPWDFMFGGNSIYSKMGGYEGSNEEFKTIIHDVLTDPHYLKLYSIKSASFTMRQLSEIQSPSNVTRSGPGEMRFVEQYYPIEQKEFIRSKQNQGALNNAPFNQLNGLFFIFTSLAMLWHYPKMNKKNIARVYLFLLLFYFINSFVTASVSTVESRFSYRIFWLLPATNVAFLLNYFVQKKRQEFYPN